MRAAAGKTNKEIAAELGLSEHAVTNYLFRAFEKMGVSSRIEFLFTLPLGGFNQHSTLLEVIEVPEGRPSRATQPPV